MAEKHLNPSTPVSSKPSWCGREQAERSDLGMNFPRERDTKFVSVVLAGLLFVLLLLLLLVVVVVVVVVVC